jgi:hypothetical protein
MPDAIVEKILRVRNNVYVKIASILTLQKYGINFISPKKISKKYL